MTEDLLFELGTEEIPAAFMPAALEDLARLFRERLQAHYLAFEDVVTVGTPRRLAAAVSGLAVRQPDREEVVTGPPARVAFSPDGRPTKAAEGFARGQGMGVEDLTVEDSGRGPYVVVRRRVPGRLTEELLTDVLPGIVTSLSFPKSMRWGAEDLRFARPIRWILALFGDQVVRFTLAGVQSGAETRGHRFMAPESVACPSDLAGYLDALSERHVLADPEVRRERLMAEAEAAAASVGGRVLRDDALVGTNTFLTESPWAVCGSFAPRFLALPSEVLITSMREHQKYFAVVDDRGALMPYFVAINNIRSPKPDLVRKGHERVLSARLSDAAFFFEEDTGRPLEALVPGLEGVVFHERLGTLLDKVRRVRDLAGSLAADLAPQETAVVERAAWLCKADLLSQMVGEFPSLQGVMGREYALRSGEPEPVARAIAEHYLPVRSGGELPQGPPGALLSVADKMDTICGTFAIGLQPTGTADPYGLRRQALGILAILEARGLRLSLKRFTKKALEPFSARLSGLDAGLGRDILAFFQLRFSYSLTARGFDPDCVEAAVRAEFDEVVDCIERAKALAAVRSRPEFEPLSVAFRRVMNIVKGFEGGVIDPALFETEAERALHAGYRAVQGEVQRLLDAGRYEEGLVALLSLKGHVDAFFEKVLVMVDDAAVRANRLALLWHISLLFLRIGDLSAIVVKG